MLENLKDGVIVYLRPTEGEGTLWAMWFPFVGLPPGVPIAFILPRVWTTWSVVLPQLGNPDIRLFRDMPVPPAVATALAPGPTAEGVSFTVSPLPWAQFHPWHLVFSGVPGPSSTNFGVGGHSLAWFF